jgi:hypothetical protein
LAAAALAFSLVNPYSLLLFGMSAAVFFITARPFMRLVHNFAPELTWLSLWFIFLRAVAFSIGIIAGIAGMFLFRYQIPDHKET